MPGPAKATFEQVTGKPGKAAKPGAQFAVMFNPASLKVSLTNKLQDEKNGGAQGGAKQSTQGTTSKLETELLFDTTETGTDVREAWAPLRKLALTPKGNSPKPPQVRFRWARFTFTGVIETLNETLDFWSSEGVPLRAGVQITLQGFGLDEPDKKKTSEKPLTATLSTLRSTGRGVIDVADDAGDQRGGRSLAAANGVEDMRAPPDGPLTVPATVDLKPPAAFSGGYADDGGGASASAGFAAGASAGAGLDVGVSAGASAGFSAGASGGFGASASAGFGAGASAGFSAGASAGFGGSATAGVSASAGAFAGLGASKTTLTVTLDPERLLPPPSAPLLGSGAQFDVTGRLVAGGSAGLSADVRGGVRIV